MWQDDRDRSAEPSARLGELLVSRGWLSPHHLEAALRIQAQSHERLGTILLAYGWVERRRLYQALSALWELPYVEVADRPQDPDLLARWPLDAALRYRAVPWERAGTVVRVAVTERPDSGLVQALTTALGNAAWEFYVTSHWDLNAVLRTHYQAVILDEAVSTLLRRRPAQSAYTVLTPKQFWTIAFLLVGCVSALYRNPVTTVIGVNFAITALFFVAVGFKFVVAMAGLRRERDRPTNEATLAALDPAALPTYTVLIPVYHEANMMRDLIAHVTALDYPPEKLEVLILIEEDDHETWEAAKAADPPEYVRLVRIPDGQPKTKPKACNVGLMFAQGEYLVIYDAEDRPEPDQLKKAILTFRQGSDRLVCVQAALNYYNVYDNWLTRMFTLEYSVWFDYLLPGLQRLRLPLPLGGTSNHFRVDRLRELGGWDPFNVTEDADLGIRAAALGYEVAMVDSTTYEEANSDLRNWIRQRSRWLKGYMQTALVYSRAPLGLVRRVGWRQALGFWLLIAGTPLQALVQLPAWAVYFLWLTTRNPHVGQYFPPATLYLGLFNLLAGNALGIYLSLMGVFKRGEYSLAVFSLANPVYWVLHSVAAFLALYQLVTRPFYWEKTLHGISPTIQARGSRSSWPVSA